MAAQVRITFREVPEIHADRQRLVHEIQRLDAMYERIAACGVLVYGAHAPDRSPTQVVIEAVVPGEVISFGRNPSEACFTSDPVSEGFGVLRARLAQYLVRTGVDEAARRPAFRPSRPTQLPQAEPFLAAGAEDRRRGRSGVGMQ